MMFQILSTWDDDDGWESDEISREQRNNDILDVTIDKNNGNENEPENSDVEDVDLADEEERLGLIVNGENMGENDKDELKRNQTNFEKEHGLNDKSKINWIQGENVQYETRNVHWHSTVPTTPVVDLPPRVEFFTKYIPDEILQQMADMTNLYGTQKNMARFPPTNLEEIKTFIGVHIVMGNLQFPRVCMYWHRSMGIPLVKDSLSLSRFYKLRQTIHLVDILSRNEDNKDRLWKVRCLYESVRKRCHQLPLETTCVSMSK
uniref:Uncharacterized protein LOC114338891 n=1 Tax=Diabrotica virgifera virgifera TaxID=50390 RepID=A0A6P7GHJ3_DIAVI